MKQAGLLAGAMLLLAAILAYPGWLLGGENYLIQGLTALGLCLVPAVATLLWVQRSYGSSPEMQLLAALGSSGIRLAVVLGTGALLYWNLPETFTIVFWVSLLVFYLYSLSLEMILVLKQVKSSAR